MRSCLIFGTMHEMLKSNAQPGFPGVCFTVFYKTWILKAYKRNQKKVCSHLPICLERYDLPGDSAFGLFLQSSLSGLLQDVFRHRRGWRRAGVAAPGRNLGKVGVVGQLGGGDWNHGIL